jgi:hypothetical protein
MEYASPTEASHLTYLASAWDSAESGLGCIDNCHLHYFAESVFVNVGGSSQGVKVSSLPILEGRVGAVIVVGGWESQPHGEGRQGVGSCKVD